MAKQYKKINARVFSINKINNKATEPTNDDIMSIAKTALEKSLQLVIVE